MKEESADKRPVATDALATLGKIIDDTAARDAIHLAVEPVIAGEHLEPGCHIGIKDGKAYRNMDSSKAEHCDKHIGIVDPFLIAPISKGQRFWLIVYPRQITSLRHVWSHPDFEDPAIKYFESTKEETLIEKSKKWMKEWAVEHMSTDYYGESADGKVSEESAYASAIEAGHDHHLGPHESADEHIDKEWWDHWERITGCVADRDGDFSCSC